MNIVCVLQARMGSSRLPGKVLKDLCGTSVLGWCVRRLQAVTRVDELVVATTKKPEDDRIEEACIGWGVPCFRGSENDVLDRYYQAAVRYGGDAVVRVTGDDPLIDPSVVDDVVELFLDNQPGVAYASNIHPRRTFPRGQDTEVMTFAALKRAWAKEHDPRLREHVTQHIVRHPETFPFASLEHHEDLSTMRWALDTPEDLEFLRTVCAEIDMSTGWLDIVSVIRAHPEWLEINRDVQQKGL